ncbi:hypothetical protein Z945_3171 [Sulfitobacter noctilucae]|uniref:hypothetical protein n=1 Tax=Sulfitobacter noctilucae TaxID=1342302 RepID=UPI000B26FD83|nr:hypothetical protein [Sulfitobacter noctilucae]KIN70707.1 hypothetical protein Z945_3171 [Sulfitobacter noctilucae]
MTPPADVVARLASWREGSTIGTASGKRYIATKSLFSAGRATKLVAEELGGSDYISLNLYELSKGAQLYPCEMPSAKVVAFVRAFVPQKSA